jgi:hypothetical protein
MSAPTFSLNNSSAIVSSPRLQLPLAAAGGIKGVFFRLAISVGHLTIEIDEIYDCEEELGAKMPERSNQPSSKDSSNF